MLQTLFRTLLLNAMHVNTSFKALFDASHLFSNMPIYGHVVVVLILMNCYGIMNLLRQRSMKIRPFYENFIP